MKSISWSLVDVKAQAETETYGEHKNSAFFGLTEGLQVRDRVHITRQVTEKQKHNHSGSSSVVMMMVVTCLLTKNNSRGKAGGNDVRVT